MCKIGIAGFDAELPKDKQGAINRVKHIMKNTSVSVLDSVPERHSI